MKKTYFRRSRLGLGRRDNSTSRKKILLWNTCARKNIRELRSLFILRDKSLQLLVDKRINKG